jgi:8-oxo-dGTP diphosphatase
MASGYDVRCSVIVVRNHAVLLLHRTYGGLDDWVLPGGTPREGENITACARRELLEETGISADPSQVAFVVESVPPGSGRRTLDIVFAASEPVLGREHSREPGLEPHFLPPGQLAELNLHPSLAGRLTGMLDPGPRRYAPYVGNSWHQPTAPRPSPGTLRGYVTTCNLGRSDDDALGMIRRPIHPLPWPGPERRPATT